MTEVQSALGRIQPNRKITGISAILLPFKRNGEIDWDGFREHVIRTANAGLSPAVNMDTGYGNLIDEATRVMVLRETQSVLGGIDFVAGAFVGDQPDSAFNRERYAESMQQIQVFGGTPVVFQSYGLTRQSDEGILESYKSLSAECDRFIGFELGKMFAPFGEVYSLELYRDLIQIKQCIGAKHSSLSRELEWQRLEIRDQVRPEFKVFTGNDLAIDMVIYGSDYLLGLSTFAPDYFALRDSYWEKGDAKFFQLNDVLQYLGCFSFRDPVPAYKHNAAMFLKLRNQIASNSTHSESLSRPESDIDVLEKIINQLRAFE